MHDEAIEVLRLELEEIQKDRVFLANGIRKMKSRNLAPRHGKIREDVIMRWQRKLKEQTRREKALTESIKVLEDLDKEEGK